MTAFPGALGVYREHPWARSSSVHSSRAGRAERKVKFKEVKGLFSKVTLWHVAQSGSPQRWTRCAIPHLAYDVCPPYRKYEAPPSSETAPQPQASRVQGGVLHIPEQHPQLARKFPDDPAGEPGGLNLSREERRSWSQGNSPKGWHSDSPTLISRCSDSRGALSSPGPVEQWSFHGKGIQGHRRKHFSLVFFGEGRI